MVKKAAEAYELSIAGTTDRIRVIGATTTAPPIEEYRFTDGTRWLAADIVRLAQTMASYSATSSGLTFTAPTVANHETLFVTAAPLG